MCSAGCQEKVADRLWLLERQAQLLPGRGQRSGCSNRLGPGLGAQLFIVSVQPRHQTLRDLESSMVLKTQPAPQDEGGVSKGGRATVEGQARTTVARVHLCPSLEAHTCRALRWTPESLMWRQGRDHYLHLTDQNENECENETTANPRSQAGIRFRATCVSAPNHGEPATSPSLGHSAVKADCVLRRKARKSNSKEEEARCGHCGTAC